MSDQRVPQPSFMEYFSAQAVPMSPFFGQGSPPQPMPAVAPSLPFPLMAAPADMSSVLKSACAAMPLPIQPCPLVLELPARLLQTLQLPPLQYTDDDVVTTCHHCRQVNTLLDLRMKELIQRCRDEAELIHYLRKQIHFRSIPGSEPPQPQPPATVPSNLSYPHVQDLCKSSNFNVDADEFRPSQVSAPLRADEFRPSQKNRSTKAEITNVNNYESAIDGYEMQSHQGVDANDLANAATESGVDSGVHDSGVSDSGILDSNTIDSISDSRIPDGDGTCNQDSRRSTESLNDDIKNQKKKSKKKDKRKKRPDSDHLLSDNVPIHELEFVNQNRKPVVDSNQNYKPLDPKLTHCNSISGGGSTIGNNVDKPTTNERVLYGGGGGGGGALEDELSHGKANAHPHIMHHHQHQQQQHHHQHHSSKTYSSHHHNHAGGGRKPAGASPPMGLEKQPPTNGVPERLKGGGLLAAPHGRPGLYKYASSGGHRGERHPERHAGPKSTNGVGVEVRKYAGHPRSIRSGSWANEYEPLPPQQQRFSTKRYENSQYNEHGGHGGHGHYGLAKGASTVQFVASVAVRPGNELEKLQLDKGVVREVQGDLFEAPSDYSLAHCVAEDLRMGAGIAVYFRKEFGGVEELRSQGRQVGQVAFLRRGERYIYYMITKHLSKQKPKLHHMQQAIRSLRELCEQHNVTKLAMPLIGCGLDKLDWNEVRCSLEYEFQNTNTDVVVYHYKEASTMPE